MLKRRQRKLIVMFVGVTLLCLFNWWYFYLTPITLFPPSPGGFAYGLFGTFILAGDVFLGVCTIAVLCECIEQWINEGPK